MKLGIVIPTYQRPLYLERALKSIAPQVNENVVVGVVDDGSNMDEEYEKVLSKFSQEKWLIFERHKRNLGVNAARNHAMKLLKEQGCDYLLFMDDDDQLLPGAISKIEDILKKYSYPWIVACRIDTKGNLVTHMLYEGKVSYIYGLIGADLRGDAVHIIATKLIGKTQFAEEIQGGESAFFLQLAQKSPMYAVKTILMMTEYLDDGLSSRLDTQKRRKEIRQFLEKNYYRPLGYPRVKLIIIYFWRMFRLLFYPQGPSFVKEQIEFRLKRIKQKLRKSII